MYLLRRMSPGFLVVLSLAFGIAPPGSGQVLTPITIEEAISSARAHHPQIAGAQAAEDQARSTLKGAGSARLPTIIAAEDAAYSNDPVFAFGSKLRQARFSSSDFDLNALNHPSPLSNFSASITATWTAFDAGATRDKVASASYLVLAAKLRTQYTEEQITAGVITLYYRVLMAEDQIAVADAALTRATEVDSDVRDRVRAGLSLESDGARANLALQDAQNEAASAKDNVQLARSDFFQTIGDPPSNRTLLHPDTEAPLIGTASPGSDPASRLDLQALRLDQQSAREMFSSIKAAAWPQVSTFGHVENDAGHFVSNGSGNWTIGAKIQLSVFDGGARKAREQETLANLHRLAAQERYTLLEAHSNINTLNAQIADLHRRLATAQSAIRVQEDALQTSRDRYASGLVSITEVLNGESELSSAEFQRVHTFYQLCIANSELTLASGNQTTSKAGPR